MVTACHQEVTHVQGFRDQPWGLSSQQSARREDTVASSVPSAKAHLDGAQWSRCPFLHSDREALTLIWPWEVGWEALREGEATECSLPAWPPCLWLLSRTPAHCGYSTAQFPLDSTTWGPSWPPLLKPLAVSTHRLKDCVVFLRDSSCCFSFHGYPYLSSNFV